MLTINFLRQGPRRFSLWLLGVALDPRGQGEDMIFDAAVHKGADMACGHRTGAAEERLSKKLQHKQSLT
jgi:hypothetical protein